MQSSQEEAIAALVQNSFGSQFLYVPREIRVTGGQREPADLAWINDDFVALFYLTSSEKRPFNRQNEHNLKQARGFLRKWKEGVPEFVLKGENKFGDSCEVPFAQVARLLVVSVVSADGGTYPLDELKWGEKEIFISMPDRLIARLARAGGSMVDLLKILYVFLDEYIKCRIFNREHYEKDLSQVANEYIRGSLAQATKFGGSLTLQEQHDHNAIKDFLEAFKIIGDSGRAPIADAAGRERVSKLFGDMSIGEYASLAAASCEVLRSSGPEFQKWAIVQVTGMHYDFVINSIKLGDKNNSEVIRKSLEATSKICGRPDAILISYSDVGGNDLRSPLWIALPDILPEPQGNAWFDKIRSLFSPMSCSKDAGLSDACMPAP